MTSAHLWLGPVPAVLAAGQPTPGFSVPARVLSIENFDRAERGLAAMHRFCDRVEAGEVRSKRTYAEFCEILGREPRK